MKLVPCALVLLAAGCGTSGLQAAQEAVISVLSPLAYSATCWSTVTLQNLGAEDVPVAVEGHKGSGALVPLVGATAIPMILKPLQNVALRLQVPGEEAADGWIKVTEKAAAGPMVAISGGTECIAGDKLTTTPQPVAYPMRNPWLKADRKDLPGKVVMVLNLANEAASAKACYSNGITAGMPGEARRGGKDRLVCTETRLLQIPPFGTRMIPVERDTDSHFSLETTGEALILRVLQPQGNGTKVYTVDSSVKFGEEVKGETAQ